VQIKTALTNLLNCEGVKNDRRYRMWVQTMLMDTEKVSAVFRRPICARKNVDAARGTRSRELIQWRHATELDDYLTERFISGY
jgi:hypothetical protein